MLICSLEALKSKEVINYNTGERLGYIDDAEINLENSQVSSLIIYGRQRFFGLFGKDDDIIIPCCDIKVIGTDVMLVEQNNKQAAYLPNSKRINLQSLFK
ncbi:MAG: YlmC/YmxH family sporulation protein [Ruminococcus sp.]|jgi:YlmC/YmxH family sporulation protein|nr:YlmC/YmxH family sporulation protein [Ruminococcus sp.]